MAAGVNSRRELSCPLCGARVGVRLEVPATFELRLSSDGEEILAGSVVAAGGPSEGQTFSEALVADAADHLGAGGDGPVLVCEGESPPHAFEVDQLGQILRGESA